MGLRHQVHFQDGADGRRDSILILTVALALALALALQLFCVLSYLLGSPRTNIEFSSASMGSHSQRAHLIGDPR